MRKYRSNASSIVRVEYGVELAAGLAQYPETNPIAAEVEAVNDDLEGAHEKRRSLRRPMIATRAKLRSTEHRVDQVLRSAFRAAEIEDGGRRGRIAMALFPKGLRPVVSPRGKGQVEPTAALVERLEMSKLAGIDAYRATWLPKLQSALAELEAAAAAHDASRAAHQVAFKAEVALRDAHLDMVDRVMGLVRAAFPRDPVLHDVIFPALDEVGAKDEGPVVKTTPQDPPSVAPPN